MKKNLSTWAGRFLRVFPGGIFLKMIKIISSVKAYIPFLLRIFIGIIFITSGTSKIFQMTPFIEVVNQLNILPEVFVIPFAALLPPLELVLGVLLIVGYLIRFSSIMIMGLLLLMLAAIFPQLLGGPKIDDCGCFGGIMDSAVDIFLIVRDMIIIVIVYIIFNQEKHILALDNQFGQFDRREQ